MHLAIDFGTCNSSAALMIDGNLRLVKEPARQGYSFPSSIYVEESGKVLVGQYAENNKFRDITRYRKEFKRDLLQKTPYVLGQNGEDKFMPQQLVTEVLKNFKQEAEKITLALDKGEITDVVVTVPATYRKNKRDAMEQAALDAGFASVGLIEEPVAAAIYYSDLNPASFQEKDIILVYDLGGGTFDATLIRKIGKGFQILGKPVGLENCGGVNFDRVIFEDVKNQCNEQLQEKLKARGNLPEQNSVVDFCRDIKHQLSGIEKATGYIPINYQLYELSRDSFNQMIDSHIEQTIVCCEKLIKSAGLESQDISKVLMVGGSCRIPFIQESIENRLQSSVLLIDEPELAVCEGAAIYKENAAYHSANPVKANCSNKKINETTSKETFMQNQNTIFNLEATEIRPWFAKHLDKLAQVIAYSEEEGKKEGLVPLALSAHIEDLKKESSRLRNGKFRFLIIGDFNRGKSTILNALFEKELLPVGDTATTAIPTFVKYGSQKKVVVHKKNGKEELSLAEYRNKYTLNSNEVKQKIGFKKLYRKYSDWLEPLNHAEFYCPIEILSRGVEFIDTAGLNHTEEENKKTFSYIEHCHAILFVLAADQPFTQKEEEYLKELLGFKKELESNEAHRNASSLEKINQNQVRPIFYLINKWENIRGDSKQEIEKSKQEIHECFIDKFFECLNWQVDFENLPEDEAEQMWNRVEQMWGDTIFNIYAKTALENLRRGKSLNGTGLEKFRERLDNFLYNDRLLNELSQAVQKAEYVKSKVFSQIDLRLLALECNVEELEKRIKEATPHVETMQEVVRRLKENATSKQEISVEKVGAKYHEFFYDLTETFEKEFEMPSVSGLRDNQRGDYANELKSNLKVYQDKKLGNWNDISKGIISETEISLKDLFEQGIRDYNLKREKIREILSSNEFNVHSQAGHLSYQSSSSKFASIAAADAGALGKMIIGATGASVSAVAAGIGGATLANLAGAHVILGTVGAAGLALTPVGWTLIGVSALSGLGAAWGQRRGEVQRFEKAMLEKAKQEFKNFLEPEKISSLKEKVKQHFDPFIDVADKLDADINSLKKSLSELLEKRRTSGVDIENEHKRLKELSEKIASQLQIIKAEYQDIEAKARLNDSHTILSEL